MLKRCVFLLLCTGALLAADLTGKWSGSFDIKNQDGTTKPGSAYLDLKQSGEEVTGTAGPNSGEQMQIQKGKLAGNKLTFEVPTGESLMKFELTFENDRIEGDVRRETGGQPNGSARLSVTRVK